MNVLCLISFVVLLVVQLSDLTKSVKVSVYYEALCPDSVNFIARQLYPNYSKLKNYMQIELVPYGKATHSFHNDKWNFDCQHGENECKGNKYQSCALAQNNGADKDVSFVNCVMRERNPSDVNKMKNCANRVNINWNKISTCAQTEQGDNLLAQNGNKTNNLDVVLTFVPTIIYNDEYDAYLQHHSLTDFAAVVCSKIEGQKPRICDNKRLPAGQNFWDDYY